MQALPEYDSKLFQNVAREGLGLDKGKQASEKKENLKKNLTSL